MPLVVRRNIFYPAERKVSMITMIKRGKELTNVESYRAISILPTIDKFFEKLLITKLNPGLRDAGCIANHSLQRSFDKSQFLTTTASKMGTQYKVLVITEFIIFFLFVFNFHFFYGTWNIKLNTYFGNTLEDLLMLLLQVKSNIVYFAIQFTSLEI